jgi:hypothetical protein
MIGPRQPNVSSDVFTPCMALSSDWPQGGAIRFQDVCMRYREGLPLVLKDITLDIKAGEKVGESVIMVFRVICKWIYYLCVFINVYIHISLNKYLVDGFLNRSDRTDGQWKDNFNDVALPLIRVRAR